MKIIKNIRHTGIVVKDLDKSLQFFVDLLGFKVLKKVDETGKFIDKILNLKNAELVTAKLKAPDGNVLEILKFQNYSSKYKYPKKNLFYGLYSYVIYCERYYLYV